MRFLLTYTALKLKELSRSTLYRGFAAFLLLLALSMALLIPRVDESSPLTLATLNEGDTRLGEAALSALRRDGGYLLRPCASRRELEALVLSGEALCGYAFQEDSDSRVEKGRYTRLVTGFYREKSPAAALCDEAVCGAVFGAVAPAIARQYLEESGLASPAAGEALEQKFLDTQAHGKPMTIHLLEPPGGGLPHGLDPLGKGGIALRFLYALLYSLTGALAVAAPFYTPSIAPLLVLAGQKPRLLRLCSFLATATGCLGLLLAAHLTVALLLPGLLLESTLLGGILLTALVCGVLEPLSRRFLSPAVLSLLPFAAALAVGLQLL